MAIDTIYLSGVPGEFTPYLNELSLALVRRGFEVHSSKDLPPGSRLAELDDTIGRCDTVICLVGNSYGPAPLAGDAKNFGHVSGAQHSLAQWEYLLADLRGKSIFFFMPDEGASCINPVSESAENQLLQKTFRDLIEKSGSKISRFKDPADFKEKVLAVTGLKAERVEVEEEIDDVAQEPDSEPETGIDLSGEEKVGSPPPPASAAPPPPAPPAPAPAQPSPAPKEETGAVRIPSLTETGGTHPPVLAPPPAPAAGSFNAADADRGGSISASKKSRRSGIGNLFSRLFKSRDKEVSLSSFVPHGIRKSEVFTIQSWIHWESDKNEVKKRAKSTGHSDVAGTKTGMEIAEGALVELSLQPRLLTDPNGGQELLSKTVRWEGHPTNVEFILMWPGVGPARRV